MRKLESLQELILRKNMLELVPEWFILQNGSTIELLPNLKELDLSENYISFITHRSFLYLRNIEKILIDNNRIQMIEPSAFSKLTVLQVLSISRNKGDHIFIHCKSFESIYLRHLILNENQFNSKLYGEEFPISEIIQESCEKSFFSYLPNLEILELNNNKMLLTTNLSLFSIVQSLKTLEF